MSSSFSSSFSGLRSLKFLALSMMKAIRSIFSAAWLSSSSEWRCLRFKWVFLWLSRLNFVKNSLRHSPHLNLLTPKWISICLVRLHSWVKLIWQCCSGHLYGLSFVWIIKWSKKLCHFRNTFPQFSCLQTINLRVPLLVHGFRYSNTKYSLLAGTCFFIPTSCKDS